MAAGSRTRLNGLPVLRTVPCPRPANAADGRARQQWAPEPAERAGREPGRAVAGEPVPVGCHVFPVPVEPSSAPRRAPPGSAPTQAHGTACRPTPPRTRGPPPAPVSPARTRTATTRNTQTPPAPRPAPPGEGERLADHRRAAAGTSGKATPGTPQVHARYIAPPVTAAHPCPSGT